MDRRVFAGALAVSLLVGVPFLTKAFHIDDTFVLTVSKQILREPLRPFHADINWGRGITPIFERTKNPPLLSYYLAPFIATLGTSELYLHLAMLPFLVMLAAGAALLGRWFWAGEWWPMLFVMLSPAVVVSGNVMRDVPAAGLLTLGLALFVFGTDEERWGLCAWGSLLVGLATLTKYSAACVVPLLVLYPLLRRRWRYAAWALVPVALLGLWSLQNYLSLGRVHILNLLEQRAASQEGFVRRWQERFYATLTIVGSTLFLLPAVLLAWTRKRAWMALPLVVMAGGAAWVGVNYHFGRSPWSSRGDRVVLDNGNAFVGHIVTEDEKRVTIQCVDRAVPARPGRHRIERVERDVPLVHWQYHLWAVCGGALLFAAVGGGLAAIAVQLVKKEEGTAETVFLVAWAVAPIAFSVVFTPFQAVRHFLPAMAPATVLALRLLVPPRRAVGVLLKVLLVAQAGVAGLVAVADYDYADTYRQFARSCAAKYKKAGRTIWFNGHWGWQQYALDEGFKHYVTDGPQPEPGDLMLDPQRVHHTRYARGLAARFETVEEVAYPARIPIRTMDQEHSYFYAVTMQRMPYFITFDAAPLEVGRVFRVKPFEKKPEAKPAAPAPEPAPGKEAPSPPAPAPGESR